MHSISRLQEVEKVEKVEITYPTPPQDKKNVYAIFEPSLTNNENSEVICNTNDYKI